MQWSQTRTKPFRIKDEDVERVKGNKQHALVESEDMSGSRQKRISHRPVLADQYDLVSMSNRFSFIREHDVVHASP